MISRSGRVPVLGRFSPSFSRVGWLMALAVAGAWSLAPAYAEPTARIAAILSQSGPNAAVDQQILDAARMVIDDANAKGATPQIELVVHDDHGTEDGAKEAARKIVASDALIVLGPGLTTAALATGPIYAEAGLANLVPTAFGDALTDNPTTFRPLFSTSEMGESLANYLRYVLNGARAEVIFKDSAFGRPVAAGFKRAAERLGIAASYQSFTAVADAEKAALTAAALPDQPAVVLVMLADESVPVLKALRRQGTRAPILAASTIATDAFAKSFADQPEERQTPGFFTNGVYAASPMILDSANADTLAFAERFEARYGQEPTWRSVQSYDATRLAVAAVRSASVEGLRAKRDAARGYLSSLDGPAHAVAGITGPLMFTPGRGRIQAVRMGRFHAGLFESAPLQLVPATNPAAAEIASGAVVDVGSGRFARRQQVIYTGVYLNELPQIDIAQSTFNIDFYLWMRYGPGAGAGAVDPTQIDFPDLARGTFDAKKTATESELPDGTIYRLWRVRGAFKNDFDLHHFPFDRQTLAVRFFNARAASDRLVYVRDRRPSEPVTDSVAGAHRVSATAFHKLSQWLPSRTVERRDILSTPSALGDPRLVGLERVREQSGFTISVDVERRVIATLAKSILPLGLLTLMIYVTLYFPAGNVMPRVATVITGALTSSVMLSSINTQLGNVAYTLAVEYLFYVFFGLCFMCLITVVTAERLRSAGKPPRALVVERVARWAFFTVIVLAAGTTALITSGW